MSLTFAVPLAFAGLAALLVPVVLHLVRRAEHRTTPFAALRFLAAAGLPRRRVRLAEIALLLLRCTLLVVLVAWLARPLLEREPPARHVVAIAPGIDAARAQEHVARIATTRGERASHVAIEARWLAPGFPPFDDAVPEHPGPVASLLRELDATLGATSRIDLIVPGVVDALDAERPRLSREIGFHVVPGVETAQPASVAPAPARSLVLRAAPDDAVARRYLVATLAAWNAERAGAWTLAELADGAAPIPSGTDALVWLDAPLSPQAVRFVEQGGTALVAGDAVFEGGDVLARDAGGAVLLREQARGAGRVLALAVPFDPARLVLLHEPDFPRRFATWLEGPAAPPDRAVADALRPERGNVRPRPPAAPLAPWLALFAALLAAIERIVASGLRARVRA